MKKILKKTLVGVAFGAALTGAAVAFYSNDTQAEKISKEKGLASWLKGHCWISEFKESNGQKTPIEEKWKKIRIYGNNKLIISYVPSSKYYNINAAEFDYKPNDASSVSIFFAPGSGQSGHLIEKVDSNNIRIKDFGSKNFYHYTKTQVPEQMKNDIKRRQL